MANASISTATESSQVVRHGAVFEEKIASRSAKIAVVGLGYVGLPLILGFHSNGFDLLGLDVDEQKVESLNRGHSYIRHVSEESTRKLTDGRFHATTNFEALGEVDAILICVPTPLSRHLEPDMKYVSSTCETIAPYLRPGQLVVLESTTYPGTTRELVSPLLEAGSGLKVDVDVFVAYSPEREDPANPDFEATTIPKVVGASSKTAQSMAVSLYGTLVKHVVPVSGAETAEAVKLTENIFRAVNIAMVNELKMIFDDMDIDIWEVIEAADTKPFGFMAFYPGPGLGGHCIPIDPFYLTWKAREFGKSTRFIELAGQINRDMPRYVVGKLRDALSSQKQKAIHGAKVLIIGVAYKRNVDDMRESPSLTLIELIEDQGGEVDYHDPYIETIPHTREHENLAGRRSQDLTAETLSRYDAVLIATDHTSVDYGLIAANSDLIVDTRNACSKADVTSKNIVKA